MPETTIRAVLFDIYGTLLDSAAGDRPPTELSLDHLLPGPKPELLHDLRRVIDAAHAASPHSYPEIDIREMWTQVLPGWNENEIERFARDAEDILSPAKEMPGAARTLRELKSHGVPLGIISNAQFYTEAVMERCLGGTLESLGFDPLLCSFSWQHLRAKPDPWLFEGIRDRLLETRGIHAGEVLFVGNDVMRDIQPANQCEFQSALLVGSPTLRLHGTTRETCGATYLIESLSEIAGLLS